MFSIILSFVTVLQKDLVIYEMNVRAFTADESSGIDPSIAGSYLGLVEKVINHILPPKYDDMIALSDEEKS